MPRWDIREIARICGATMEGAGQGYVEGFAIDSRHIRAGDLFIPLLGEKVDAHRFIPDVYHRGCRVSFVSGEALPVPEGMTYLRVENTLRAIQDLAAYYRKTLSIPFVAVTGSVGKTGTREMTAAALSVKYKVYQTGGNSNGQIGVPLTILGITKDAQIAVIEMGISEPGEMSRIADIVAPDMALVSNIGDAHMEFLGSREDICREKFHIMDKMKAGSRLLVNGEDRILLAAEAYPGVEKILVFAGTLPKEENFSYYVRKQSVREGFAHFTASIGGEEVSCSLPVPGAHQVGNAMLALTAASLCGADVRAAAKKLEEFKTVGHRQEIRQKGNSILIDDSYNASPDSMRAALQVLKDMGGRRKKIAVLADMKELGRESRRLHEEVGAYAAGLTELACLYTFGENAAYVYAKAKEEREGLEALHFQSREELLARLQEDMREESIILLKGSNSMRLYELAEELTRE